MKRMTAMAFTTLTVIAAGCGGGGDESSPPVASPTTSEVSTPTTPAETTPTIDYATTQQYASIVASNALELNKYIDTLNGPKCTLVVPGQVDLVSGSIVCAGTIIIVGLKGMTLQLSLTGAMKPSAPAFIGPPPPEIASLVDETVEAAKSLGEASDAAQPCAYAAKPGCDVKLFELGSAMSAMQTKLAGWGPYE